MDIGCEFTGTFHIKALLNGMRESDLEPSGFWTAAPNNRWRDASPHRGEPERVEFQTPLRLAVTFSAMDCETAFGNDPRV